MDLTKFLEDLKKFKEMEESNGRYIVIDHIIKNVEDQVEEIKIDHLQGDADDANK